MSCLVMKSLLFSTPYFLCLKFAGNLEAVWPHFHACATSVYKTDKGSYRDQTTLAAALVAVIML